MRAAPARLVAARALERVTLGGEFADETLEHEVARQPLDPRDVALATELVYGTLRWQRHLDWRLAPHSRRPIDAIDPHALVVLRLAAYQLLFLERVPAFAVVSDAVELVRRSDTRGLDRFVNAVLRSLTRATTDPPLPASPVEAAAVEWSMPTWLADRWIARYGRAEATALMRAMNERPPLTARANVLRTTRDALAARLLEDDGLASRPTTYAPEGLHVEHGGLPSAWRAFAEGLLALQDEASMLVSRLLDPHPGEVVADACAAPGTKTMHLAELMGDRGRIVALDPQPKRLERVREAAARLGIHAVETIDGPVEAVAPTLGATCDAVLVDAPCSNLGVLRRNPDVKWRRRESDLDALATRQRDVLAAAATMVKRGGRVVYATCSLEPEENDAVVRSLMEARPEFAIAPPAEFPIALEDGVLRCLPHRHGTDGFTAIRLTRHA